MRQWTIDLPWKSPPLSMNDRMHWAQKAKITRTIRLLAKVKTRNIPDLERCRAELVWHVGDRRKRDLDNPWPTMKALCDGLVDAEIVADDTPDLMEKLIRLSYVAKQTNRLELVVTEI